MHVILEIILDYYAIIFTIINILLLFKIEIKPRDFT